LSTRGDRFSVLKAAIEKRHGRGVIGRASMMRPQGMPRLRTGSLALDYAFGGGVPVGRTTLLHGPESSGKSTLLYRIMGLAQKVCANCLRPVDVELRGRENRETGEVEYYAVGECGCFVDGLFEPKQYNEETDSEFSSRVKGYEKNSYEEYRVALVDMENSYDRGWGYALGVDNDRLVHVVPHTGEEADDMYVALATSGAFDFIAIDSIAMMTPSKEFESSAEDGRVGEQARLVNSWVRRTGSASNAVISTWKRPLTQVWINQEREKIGVAFGDPTTLPGGKAQLFAPSCRVKLWTSKWTKEKVDSEFKADWQMDIGSEVQVNFKFLKNKTAPALASGSFRMGVRGSEKGRVMEIPYVVQQAEKYSAIRTEGEKSKKVWFLGDEEFGTKADMLARLEEPSVFVALKEALLAKMLEDK